MEDRESGCRQEGMEKGGPDQGEGAGVVFVKGSDREEKRTVTKGTVNSILLNTNCVTGSL